MSTTFEKAMARVKKMNLVPSNNKTKFGALHCSVGFSTSADVKRRRKNNTNR